MYTVCYIISNILEMRKYSLKIFFLSIANGIDVSVMHVHGLYCGTIL